MTSMNYMCLVWSQFSYVTLFTVHLLVFAQEIQTEFIVHNILMYSLILNDTLDVHLEIPCLEWNSGIAFSKRNGYFSQFI